MNHAIFWAFQSHTENIFVVWTSWNVYIYTDTTFCPPNLTLARIKFKRYDKDEDSGFGKLVCSEKKTHNRDLKWIHNSVIEIKYSYLLITKMTKSRYIHANTTELNSVKAKGTERDNFSYSALNCISTQASSFSSLTESKK